MSTDFHDIIFEAKGPRSIRQLAEDSGVDCTRLRAAINKRKGWLTLTECAALASSLGLDPRTLYACQVRGKYPEIYAFFDESEGSLELAEARADSYAANHHLASAKALIERMLEHWPSATGSETDPERMMQTIRTLHLRGPDPQVGYHERNKMLTRLRKAAPHHWAGLVHELARETEAAR